MGTATLNKVTRRRAISTVGKIAIAAGVSGVIAGLGGYLVGSTSVGPPSTVTVRETLRETVTVAPSVTTPTVAITTPTGKIVEVTFVMWAWGVETFKKLLEEWDQKHPEYKATLVDYPEATYREAVVSRFMSGEPIDVLQSDPVFQAEFYESGYIVPIEDYFPEIRKALDDYWPGYRETCFYKGHMMGSLYYGANTMLQYNTEYLEKAGIDEPPKTWEEVVDQSLKIKEKGISDTPICAFLGSYAFWQTIYAFIAGQAKTKEEIPLFDPETLEPRFETEDHPLFNALRFLLDAIHKYKIMSTASITYTDVEVIAGMGGGSHAFGWVPWYDIGPANSPGQPMYKKLQIALNPGPGHWTSCWGRPYNFTKMCRDRGFDAMEAAYKLMCLFGGKVNPETLDPDWENGRWVLGLRILPIGGTPLVWTISGLDYPETKQTIEAYADLNIAKEQFKYLFNHQFDPPGPPYWIVKWSGGWGVGPARTALEGLLYGQRGTSDEDIMNTLKEMALRYKEVKKEYMG